MHCLTITLTTISYHRKAGISPRRKRPPHSTYYFCSPDWIRTSNPAVRDEFIPYLNYKTFKNILVRLQRFLLRIPSDIRFAGHIGFEPIPLVLETEMLTVNTNDLIAEYVGFEPLPHRDRVVILAVIRRTP
jgi:hypothetical protein